MEIYLFWISFLSLLNYSIQIVPIWDITTSAINLLSSVSEYDYIIVDRDLYSQKAKLRKILKKTESGITHENYLSINGASEFKVDFENIESFYFLNQKFVICPKGKYQLYDATHKEYIPPSSFTEKGKWDLKCYKHNTKYFLLFYLMNGDKPYYFSTYQDSEASFSWTNKGMASQLYDFKLEDGTLNEYPSGGWYKYPMGALILDGSYLKLKSFAAEFHFHTSNDEKSYIGDASVDPKEKTLIETKTYTQAYFKNYSDEFYFMTYNNASDFTSGYSNVTTSDYKSIGGVQVHINKESPFEFIDDVEIKEMNFLLYNKYIYYAIYNPQTNITYHGIYDVVLNKIMFNTDIDIP